MVVGSHQDDDNGSDSGSAYVFSASTGTQLHKLLPLDGVAGDLFGRSVAVSGDTVVVGAEGKDDNGSDSGSAYVFSASTGTQLQIDSPLSLNQSSNNKITSRFKFEYCYL